MSYEELVLVAGAGAAVLASASLILYSRNKREGHPTGKVPKEPVNSPVDAHFETSPKISDEHTNLKPMKDLIDEKSGHRIIPKSELERSRRELKTLELERELVSGSLTRLYEAEAIGEITKQEREILSAKYRGELQSLDDRIQKIDALVQIGDLETLRDQLIRLVSQKIDAIETRLERTRIIAEPLIASLKRTQPSATEKADANQKSSVPDISDLLVSDEKSSPTPQSEFVSSPTISEGNVTLGGEAEHVAATNKNKVPSQVKKKSAQSPTSKADELQKEILEALDRLEKLDIEG